MEFYVIKEGKQTGPWRSEDLKSLDVKEDTQVWREGLEEWVSASSLEELRFLFEEEKTGAPVPPPYSGHEYFAMLGETRIGPMSASELVSAGVKASTPVWTEGMSDWELAETQEAFRKYFSTSPNTGSSSSSGVFPEMTYVRRTSWMGWAIAASIVNFLTMWAVWFPVIGLVFGIIGIVYSQDADTKFKTGFPELGMRAASQSKTMTIVSLVIAGIAILGAIVTVFLGLAFLGALL